MKGLIHRSGYQFPQQKGLQLRAIQVIANTKGLGLGKYILQMSQQSASSFYVDENQVSAQVLGDKVVRRIPYSLEREARGFMLEEML